jgi:apolipoprotein N-acyltransferase
VALTPLVIAIAQCRPAAARGLNRPFVFGLVTGGVHFAGTLYWLVETMTTFGGLSIALAVLAAFLLVAYLALFPAAFAAVLARLVWSMGPAAILFAPPVWVASELGRQYVWDGFPWALLGYSQVMVLPIAQLASVVGVYGLSALLALSSAACAYAIVASGRSRWLPMLTTGLLVAFVAGWGQARLQRNDLLAMGDPVRAAVLQGNIAQEDKWNPALRDAITDRYLAMTRQAIDQGATLILWPESSTPFYFERDLIRGAAIRRLAVDAKVTLLIGSDQVEPIKAVPGQPGPQRAERYYNAAFLVKPDGSVGGVYRKMHLVPFGEYVPAKRIFFFVGPIVDALSDSFAPGTEPVLLPVAGHHISTAICYEVIYGSLMRDFVTRGSELLTTITNDAWYGRSSAAYQHWDQASLRAIESGRFLARAANTGISGFVDPYGRVLAKSALFEQAVMTQDIRFLRHRTIYSRIGDAFAWLSLALTVAAFLAARRVR